MSKIKNSGLDQFFSMALIPSNSSNLEQLALKGLNVYIRLFVTKTDLKLKLIIYI